MDSILIFIRTIMAGEATVSLRCAQRSFPLRNGPPYSMIERSDGIRRGDESIDSAWQVWKSIHNGCAPFVFYTKHQQIHSIPGLMNNIFRWPSDSQCSSTTDGWPCVIPHVRDGVLKQSECVSTVHDTSREIESETQPSIRLSERRR